MKTIAACLLFVALPLFAGDRNPLKVGEDVPLFTLKNYDGKEYGLEKALKESKLAVVMFIATQCPVSNAYNERMAKLHEQYGRIGVSFVGINSNKQEGVSEIATHAKAKGFKFPVLKDAENKIADAYGAQVTPEIYVVSPKGKLLYHGRIDDSRDPAKVEVRDLTKALDALLSGKEPPRAETKAFGCSIKRISSD